MIIGEDENGEPVEADDERWLFDDAYGEHFGNAGQAIEMGDENGLPDGYEIRFIEEMHVLYNHSAVLFGTMPCTGKSNALLMFHAEEYQVPAVLRRAQGKSWTRAMFERITRGGRDR